MASTPHDDAASYADRKAAAARDDETPRVRSVGEHVFIWVAWALAAAFWGATLTTMTGILRAAGATVPTVSAPGAPGGLAYLALVVTAFVVMAAALAYASLRSATQPERVGERATATPYDTIERQGGED